MSLLSEHLSRIKDRIRKAFYSEGAYALWYALGNAEKWTYDERVATHVSGVTMWTYSGPLFFDGFDKHGTPNFLGYLERWFLWKRYKKMRNAKIAWRILNGSLIAAILGKEK